MKTNEQFTKKLISMVLCLAMVLSYLPTDVFAVESEKTVLDITQGNITINTDGATVGTTNVAADPDGYIIQGNDTATGNVINVTGGTHNIELNRVRIGSDAKHTNGRSPLTIAANAVVTLNLVGENTLGEGWDGYHTVNIVVGDGATLNIDGSGSLSCNENISSSKLKIGTGGTVEVKGGTVTLRTTPKPVVTGSGAFIVSNGNVTLRTDSSDSYGRTNLFDSGVSVTVSGGTVTQIDNADAFGAASFELSGGTVIFNKEFSDLPKTNLMSGMLYEAGNLSVYGNQTLSADFEVPSGKSLTVTDGATLTVDAGVTLTNNGTIQNNGSIIVSLTATVSGTINGNPEAYQGASGNIDVSTLTDDLRITATGYTMNGRSYLYEGNYTLTGTTSHGVIFEAGEYQLTANNLKIVKGDTYSGSAIELKNGANLHLVLAGDNTLTGGWEGSGIRVNEGTSLTISGDGTLHAGYQQGGNAAHGAAIGGYCDSNFGTITINGGTIYATGTSGASIGSGGLYNTGNTMTGTIELNGGTIYADLIGNARSSGAVLKGSGAKVYCDSIRADTSGFNEIVYSKDGTSANVYNDLMLSDDFEVPSAGLIVKEGAVLTIPEGKTLTIAQNRQLICYGAIVNNGTIAGAGTVVNCMAQSDLTGSGTVAQTVSVKAVGSHVYGQWEPVDANTHKKTCQNGCGKTMTEEHSFENDVCTGCGKGKSWRYDEVERTLYILADLTIDDMYDIHAYDAECIVFAEGVRSIPDDVFHILHAHEVKSVHIPESIERIGLFAFDFGPLVGNTAIVFYCPEDIKDEVANSGGGHYGEAKVYVSYKMEDGMAKVTAVEATDPAQIDSNAVLDTVLYGKNVYFEDGTLIYFPNTTHVHRGTQWTNNGNGTCSGTCVVCRMGNITHPHEYCNAVPDSADNTQHILTCEHCGDPKEEAHNYTYTASGNRLSAVCGCGHTGSLEINEIAPQTYTGRKVQTTLSGTINGVASAITYCCADGCVNAGTHTARIVLGDAEATMQFEILKVDTEIGKVTAGDLNNSLDTSEIVLNREDSTVPGVLSVDAEQTLRLGDNDLSYTFTPADAANYKVVTGKVTVTVVDTIAPTGTVTISTKSWSEFLNNITFGLFFKETQNVSVVATDNLSGVAKIEYIESKTAMDLDAVKAATRWTEMKNSSVSVTLEDTKQFVYYIRITDKSGNVSYLSSDGAEYDTSTPGIAGVNNGETYYTTQKVTINDKNIDTIKLNGEAATSTITLAGNKEATYIIVATDKAGNTTTVTVKMTPIADIAESMDGMTSNDVTSADKTALQTIVDTVTELLKDEELPAEEKAALEKAKADAEILLIVIENADKAADTENTDKVEDVTADNVTPEDKSDLEKAKADLEKALVDNGGNYTAEEKKAIKDELKRIEDALKVIENVEAVEDAISNLPATVEPDDEENVAKIEAAKKAYDALSTYEKSLVSKQTKETLDKLTTAAVAYDIIKGDGSEWKEDSNETLSFTANGAVSKFLGIEINGKTVDPKHYEVKAGSTIVTLKQDYLDTLEAGKYTITFLYTNGETEGTFIVEAAEEETVPPTTEETVPPTTEETKPSTGPATGDDANVMLWTTMLLFSVLAMTLLLVYNKKFVYKAKYLKK